MLGDVGERTLTCVRSPSVPSGPCDVFDSLQTVRNLRLDRPDFRCARHSFLIEGLYCRRRPQRRRQSAVVERHYQRRPRTADRRRAGARTSGRPRGRAHAYRFGGSVSVQDDRAGNLHHQREQARVQADGRDRRGECRETPRADSARDGGDGAADAQGDHRAAEQGAQRFGAARSVRRRIDSIRRRFTSCPRDRTPTSRKCCSRRRA